MSKPQHMRSIKQQGLTLIEILVTLTIMSFGLLGLAGLQLVGIKNTESGYKLSQVAFLANDIMERMQVNLESVGLKEYDIALGASPTAINCFGIDKNCTPAQMADFDVIIWKRYLSSYLANGDGSIVTNAQPNVVDVTITLQWLDEYQAENPNQTASFQMSFPR